MEYAGGGDATHLRGKPAREVMTMAIAVADAMEFAHRAGVIHRDLKPANILLTADGAPRVADFGMALLLAQSPATWAGRGSPYYMSPQQQAGMPATVADDIYAFGVLLYELLSGYPPFYPDIDAARLADEIPTPLARSGMPQALVDFVAQCLHKQTGHRPQTMQAVQRTLTHILASLPLSAIVNQAAPPNESPPTNMGPIVAPPKLPAQGHGEPLRSEWQRSNQANLDAAELRRQGFRRGLFASALVLGLAAVVLVFVVLPRWVAPPATSVPTAKPASSTPLAVAPPKELDFAALAQAKQQAEELRAPLDERLQKLDGRAVKQWGEAPFNRAIALLAAGDERVAARDYAQAVARFTSIEPILQQLEKQAVEVLAEQLQLGTAALATGRSAEAQQAFGLAQKIDASNQAAASGLKRATTLDAVLKTLAEADRAEQDNDMLGAATAYRQALSLDAQTVRATEGLARVQSRIAGNAFASAMAQGFGALTKADYAGARSAFESAGKLRPGANEVTQALQQVEQEERTRTINGRLGSARQFESTERWAEALREYQAVAQLDSTVTSASEGIARTRPRAELHQQLEIYVTQPERLFSAPVRNAAHSTLQRARAITSPGPVLEQQIGKVAEWLARAEVPVAVTLVSDNATAVTIRRVGELGVFERHSMSLAPGSYIVVGTRAGYRDVRREMTIAPGSTPQPFLIRCEEKI
jgi:tetratricopeptide (TPR) repeat protein